MHHKLVKYTKKYEKNILGKLVCRASITIVRSQDPCRRKVCQQNFEDASDLETYARASRRNAFHADQLQQHN